MLSDRQLMLLEQLTYMSSGITDVCGAEAPTIWEAGSLEELLGGFDENALQQLENIGTINFVQGSEWAAVIREIRSDPELMALQISDHAANENGCLTALTFTSPGEVDGAIVAFRGTTDGDEWADNMEGLNRSDTKAQKEALDYVEALPYEKITVVGHSKGGNKAQYVSVLSPKVIHGVSMDGQGFSDEFLEKYEEEIRANAGKVTCYSLENDFVHILLQSLPGAEQLYVTGSGMENGAENHSPDSFFCFGYDEEGRMVLQEKDGEICLAFAEESSGMAYLHGFTVNLLQRLPEAEKEELVYYLSALIRVAAEGETVRYQGNTYDASGIAELVISNPSALASVLSCFLLYTEEHPLTVDIVQTLLRDFQLSDADGDQAADSSDGRVLLQGLPDALLSAGNFLRLQGILRLLSVFLAAKGLSLDLNSLSLEVLKNLGDWKNRSGSTGSTVVSAGDYTRDYSSAAEDAWLSVCSGVGRDLMTDPVDWSSFRGESWYEEIGAGAAEAEILSIRQELYEQHQQLQERVRERFAEMDRIDRKYGRMLQALQNEFRAAVT